MTGRLVPITAAALPALIAAAGERAGMRSTRTTKRHDGRHDEVGLDEVLSGS
jgi:hypothetical protein